jgi:hypothetical protein
MKEVGYQIAFFSLICEPDFDFRSAFSNFTFRYEKSETVLLGVGGLLGAC